MAGEVQVRMLGRFEVVAGDVSISLRSHKVGCLLAYLALHSGKAVAGHTLQDLLWPDADGDRQNQSLRRAIADLRDALEPHVGHRAMIRSDDGMVGLDPDVFATDVERFERLVGETNAIGFGVRAAEALALYAGPLLAPVVEDWVYAYRRHYEEIYCATVDLVTVELIEQKLAREAVRIANSAILLAPLREEPFVAAIRAYMALDNRSMALQQFEALERMLDDNFGQTPPESAVAALDGTKTTPPQSTANSSSHEEDRRYVRRRADAIVDAAMDRGESVILVNGPRQVGKTSLAAHAARRGRGLGWQVAVTDFQALSRSEIERPPVLYRTLVHGLAQQLGVDYEPIWNEWIGANANLDQIVDSLLRRTDRPVCWVMDEVDRLFRTDYSDDFFGLLRSWHNRRALDPQGPWRRLSMLICYASEAHLFIKDLNQSPFNVGIRAELRDFTAEETEELADRHQPALRSAAQAIHGLTNGHPFLTRRAFAAIEGGMDIEGLRRTASLPEGPFADHLRQVERIVRSDPALLQEVQAVLEKSPAVNQRSVADLISAGIVVERDGKHVLRTGLYAEVLSALSHR